MNYEQLLFDICKNTAKILVNLPSEPNGTNVNPLRLRSKLIFPNYEQDDKKTRISEQEARFAFCQIFEQGNHGLYYSVETPTKFNYSFKLEDKTKDLNDLKIYSKDLNPSKGKSAQSDMSIFSLTESGFNQIINVEFKAKNVETSHIAKDFLKLFAEPQHGLFFHLLESVDSGTLMTGYLNDATSNQKGILTKYLNSMNQLKDNSNIKIEIINESWFLFFSICILSPEKYLITKVFKKSDFKNINDFFDLQYSVSKGKIDFKDELKKSNPWNILQI